MVAQKLAKTFCLRDGRLIGYAEFGDPNGFPLVYCHGFPASRLEGGLLDAAARRQRARVIAADRPGYGLSTWQAGRAMTDWPDDISQLLEHLGIDRFAVLGVSGGGPYGLSLLAKLADRIATASLVCPLGPVYQPELVQAMHWPARLGFVSAQYRPWLLQLVYGHLFGPAMRANPSVALALLTVSIPPADRAILAQDGVKSVVCDSIGEALKTGMRGALRDFYLYAHPWGFDLSSITLPLVIWHGEDDATVPISHSRFLADRLPNAKLHTVTGAGHFSLPIGQADTILADLINSIPQAADNNI